MLTPQEVAERSFKKSTFGGYNMAMVDDFLDELTTDYKSLYEENALLKRKLKVLADKIEEQQGQMQNQQEQLEGYRRTDEQFRKAILEYQAKMEADVDTQRKKQMEDLERDAEARRAQLQAETAVEEQRLEQAKQSALEYLNGLKNVLAQEITRIRALEEMTADVVPAPAAEPEPAAEEQQEEVPARADEEEIAADIEQSIAGEEGTDEPAAEAPAAEQPKPDDTAEGSGQRDGFENLQFGSDYTRI